MSKRKAIGIVGVLLALNVVIGFLVVGAPGVALADDTSDHEEQDSMDDPSTEDDHTGPPVNVPDDVPPGPPTNTPGRG